MNQIALLPNLAGPDMLLIFFIVLIMFGAKKLPELARGMGQAVREFSKAKDDVNSEFQRAASGDSRLSDGHYAADPHSHGAGSTAPSGTPGGGTGPVSSHTNDPKPQV
jgi:sec-independent protein translocase protein TatA